MTKAGAVGLVAAFIGLLAMPVAILVVVQTEVHDASRFLPLAPALVLVAGGALLAVFGRRRRSRASPATTTTTTTTTTSSQTTAPPKR